MPKRRIKHDPVPQKPKEKLIPGNKRVVAPSGRTTWEVKQ